MKKPRWNDFEERIRDVVSDPANKDIPRHKNAGKKINGKLIMHNGLKTVPNVFGPFFKIFKINKGVHEPQEERVFAHVLQYVPKGGVMIELGAYWSFYSMWFYKQIKNAQCFLLEEDVQALKVGKKNFKINNMRGDFTLGHIGKNGVKIDDFIRTKGLKRVDILHADIQGAELEMLLGAEKSISEGKIKFLFISSHGQELHYKCLDYLQQHNYKILASADFDRQTYCWDGVLVAQLASMKNIKPIKIALANWDTGDFLNDAIYYVLTKLCPYELLPQVCLYLYYKKDYQLLESIFKRTILSIRTFVRKQ